LPPLPTSPRWGEERFLPISALFHEPQNIDPQDIEPQNSRTAEVNADHEQQARIGQ
jgi:hypothetical protein